TAMALPSFAIFVLYPITGPRPSDGADVPLYAWLVHFDAVSNCMPSLHAGLTVYSMLFGWQVTAGWLSLRQRSAIFAFAGAWAGAIFDSTLATKQHYAVDLLAGAGVAVVAYACSARACNAAATVTPPSACVAQSAEPQ